MQKLKLIRYRVKADRVDANIAEIRAVFEELRRRAPGGVHYTSAQAADGVTFVHLFGLDDGGIDPMGDIAAFATFTAGVRDRCEEGPNIDELTPLGAYRVFTDNHLEPTT